jgi:hypothetical protein
MPATTTGPLAAPTTVVGNKRMEELLAGIKALETELREEIQRIRCQRFVDCGASEHFQARAGSLPRDFGDVDEVPKS